MVITGVSFTGATAVSFGTDAAAAFTVDSDTQISAVTPAATAATVDVTVTGPGGTSATSIADQFTFTASSSSTTPVLLDPNATPVPAGTLPPDTWVVEVPAGVVPVVVPDGAVAVQAGTLSPDAVVALVEPPTGG